MLASVSSSSYFQTALEDAMAYIAETSAQAQAKLAMTLGSPEQPATGLATAAVVTAGVGIVALVGPAVVTVGGPVATGGSGLAALSFIGELTLWGGAGATAGAVAAASKNDASPQQPLLNMSKIKDALGRALQQASERFSEVQQGADVSAQEQADAEQGEADAAEAYNTHLEHQQQN